MNNMKNSEICEGAIEVLEKEGWVKGEYHVPGEGYCLVGAGLVALGVGIDVRTIPATALGPDLRVRQAIKAGISGTSVTIFNDSGSTTYEDALKALTDAAKYWRDKGE